MDVFYVYEHWRPDTDKCFYVGKGKGRRAYQLKNRSKNSAHYDRIVAKLARNGFGVDVRIIHHNLSEQEAFRLERELIAYWRENGDALINKTDGGEGPSGYKFDPEVVERLAAKRRGVKQTPEHRSKISAGNKGKVLSAETRAKISAAHTGKIQGPHSEEHRAKIGSASRGRKDSPETREKKRLVALARPPQAQEVRDQISAKMREKWQDAEYRAALSEAHKAYEFTEEHRASLREAMAKRPPRSEEHKARIAASIREHWATKRRKAG